MPKEGLMLKLLCRCIIAPSTKKDTGRYFAEEIGVKDIRGER